MRKKLIIGGAAVVITLAAIIMWNPLASKAQENAALQTFTLKRADLTDSILVSGTIKSSDAKNIYSKVNYPVKKVYFEVGDKVKAGDILAELDTDSLELDIRQTELNIRNAEESLKNESASNQYNLQNALNAVESASLELKNAQKDYDEIKGLYEAGASSLDEFLKAESLFNKARLSYDNAQASLENVKSKNSNTTRNNIEIQKVTLEKQRKTLNDAKITAPGDGTVTLVNVEENGASSGLLFVIEDIENLVVSTAIGEYDISYIKPGQEVIVKADSTGDREFTGVISQVAPTAAKDAGGNTASSSNVQFETEIVLKSKDPNIKIGMNVRLTVKVNEKKDVYSLPYDALVTEADGSQWIYVLEAAQEETKPQSASKKIKVQTGMETDMYVEVSSPDLADGMKVLLNPEEGAQSAK